MRIAILWQQLTGYLNACLKELAKRPGVELMVVHQSAGRQAPYQPSQFSWIQRRMEWDEAANGRELTAALAEFSPDVVLVSSWHIRSYRYVLRHLRPRPLRVLCMDNQWLGTWKQRLGVASSRVYVQPLYDAVFLPGERQATFARLLGFVDHEIWSGLYCPDFAHLSARVRDAEGRGQGAFGYLGRLSPEKGIEELVDAYGRYRATVRQPWDLVVAGEGPLAPIFEGMAGVRRYGFIQPADLPDWLDRIDCLVLPSRFEPWGTVVSEAAAAGLPVIASDACGSVPHLVHDYVNGRVVRAGDAGHLEEALLYAAGLGWDERMRMGQVSRGLASVYTPERWATTVIEGAKRGLRTRAGQSSRPSSGGRSDASEAGAASMGT